MQNRLFTAIALAIVLAGPMAGAAFAQDFRLEIPEQTERPWVGPDVWTNRPQDWRISNGRVECLAGTKNRPMRTAHLVTRRLEAKPGSLFMSVRTGAIGGEENTSASAAAGFLIGAGPELDYRAASLIHSSTGPGGGLFAGIDGKGRLFLRDFGYKFELLTMEEEGIGCPDGVAVTVSVQPRESGGYALLMTSLDPRTGEQLGSLRYEPIEPVRLIGNLALVSHPGGGGRFWFDDWTVGGDKVTVYPERNCGPILSTQYTLSGGVLKMTAQCMPIGMEDNQYAVLELWRDGEWVPAASADIIMPGYTATFRVEDWDYCEDIPYRALYWLKGEGGTEIPYAWHGTVRRDPVDKGTIVVAGFTGNHNTRRGVESGYFTWSEAGVWFPHGEVTEHVALQDPDVLFFSGDQVYEGASPTFPDRANIYLDYMYKWYLWCWAYRDLAKDIPCITIPDDHDVYQGNLWGAGGRATPKDDKGGYVHPANFVRMVERTQCANLPDPYDPTPIDQGIGVYYTNMTYGRVSFAVLEDRKFKSGCDGLIPGKTGRADHVTDPAFDVSLLDQPGLKLLGDRQLAFLRDWAADWTGADFKVALSQTVFANAATLHGADLARLHADLDSNGWPQSGRARALHELRKGFAFMYGGDQHLATIIHHGIDRWNDAGWSFTVPSVANFYPRAWVPLEEGKNREPGSQEYTGEFLDGLGNPITVYAHTNPGKSMGHYPAALHDRMPGYGIIRLNKETREITMECWPRFANPLDPEAKQYEGWPRTIHLYDNYGKEPAAYLPTLVSAGLDNPVVQLVNENTDEIVYTVRVQGRRFQPKVFQAGRHTIRIGDPDTGVWTTLKSVETVDGPDEHVIEIQF